MKKIGSLAIASLFVLSIATVNANTLVERFTTDPALDGWRVLGDTNLFQWDSTNQNLDVTWDSSQPSSCFYHPLGRTLTTNDSFCVVFDLRLNDAIASGFGNELAIGLLRYSDATNAGFSRAYGNLPNLFELDYFPADDYGDPPSIDGTLVDASGNFYFIYDNLPLNPGVAYQVVLIHHMGEIGISGTIYTNGQILTTLPKPPYSGNMGEFQLDTLSVNCYADDGAGDSILAHGAVGRLAVASPLPVDRITTPATGRVQFASDTNWLYTLEKSADFQTWTAAAPGIFGNGTNLVLQATNLPGGKSLYRVRADLP